MQRRGAARTPFRWLRPPERQGDRGAASRRGRGQGDRGGVRLLADDDPEDPRPGPPAPAPHPPLEPAAALRGARADQPRHRRGRVGARDRPRPWPRALDYQPRDRARRRPAPLPRVGRRTARLRTSHAPQGGQARAQPAAARRGGGRARAPLVAAADLRQTERRPSRRSGDADLTRDDLPIALRPVAG